MNLDEVGRRRGGGRPEYHAATEPRNRSPLSALPDTDRHLTLGVVLLLLVIGLLVYPLRAQEASRMALTASIYERGTVEIDGYPIGVDRAVRDGQTYSDKGPGQPVLALPFYGLALAIGLPTAAEFIVDRNLTLWLVTFASTTVPALVLFFVMRELARPIGRRAASIAAAAIATGTVLLPFSTILFGHVLSALSIAGAVLLIQRRRPQSLWFGGLLAGFAVTVEYTAAIAVVVLSVWVLIDQRRRAVWFLLGGLVPAVALGVYNTIAFGDPWTLSYQLSAFSGVPDTPAALTGIFTWGGFDNLVAFLFSGRGLVIATPIVLAGVVGTVLQIRDAVGRRTAIVMLTVFGLFCLLPVFWGNPWGGESPGARYMASAIPLLAPGLAYAWRRRPVISTGVWAVSGVTMLMATLTDALILGREHPGGLSVWARLGLGGEWMPNVFGLLWGITGDIVFLGLLLLAITGVLFGIVGVRRFRAEAA